MSSPFEIMPVLGCERSPLLSLILGFIFGSVGIGLYWLSFIDFIISFIFTLVVNFLLNFLFPGFGLLIANLTISIYAYYRAADSNRRLQ